MIWPASKKTISENFVVLKSNSNGLVEITEIIKFISKSPVQRSCLPPPEPWPGFLAWNSLDYSNKTDINQACEKLPVWRSRHVDSIWTWHTYILCNQECGSMLFLLKFAYCSKTNLVLDPLIFESPVTKDVCFEILLFVLEKCLHPSGT